MSQGTLHRCSAQSREHLRVVPDTGRNTRNRQQQIRERLELRALALGADHVLSQLTADRWLRGVVL
jgi:hypothetical protein